MPTGADREAARPETIPARPSDQELVVAVAVVGAAVLFALLGHLGLGVLVITLALLAAALWQAYGTPRSTTATEEFVSSPAGISAGADAKRTFRPSLPSISAPSLTFERETVSVGALVATLASVAGIVIAGGFLYLRDRSTNPPGFFADEAEIGIQSWKLLHWDAATSRIPFFYHHLEYHHLGTLSLFSTAPFVGVFGLTDEAVRGASAFWTIAAAIVIYFTLRRLGIPYAAVAVLAMMVSPLVILVSRVNFGHASSLMAMSSGFLLWVMGRQKERKSVAFAGGVLIGLSAYGQSSYYVGAPLLFLAIGVVELIYNRSNWPAYRSLLWLGIGGIVILLPVPYRARTDPMFLDRYRDKTVGAEHGIDRISSWMHAYPDYLSFDLIFGNAGGGWLTRHYFPGAPLVFPAVLIFLVVGLASLLLVRDDGMKRFVWPMALVLLLFPIPDIVSRSGNDAPYSYSFVWGAIAIPFVVGYGLKGLQLFARRFALPRVGMLYAAAVLAILLWSAAGFWRGAFASYPDDSADYWGWQYGAKPAAEYFKAHAGEYDEFYLSGDFNAAYILTEFFMHDAAIESVTYTGGLEFLDLGRRQLFALRADEWQRYPGSQYPGRSYLSIVGILDYPNGDPAMYLVAVAPTLLRQGEQEIRTPAG